MNLKLNKKHAILKAFTLLCAGFFLFVSFQATVVDASKSSRCPQDRKSMPNGLRNGQVDQHHHTHPKQLHWFDSLFSSTPDSALGADAAAEKLHVFNIDLMKEMDLDFDIQHIGSHEAIETPSAPSIPDTQLPVNEIQYWDHSTSLIEDQKSFLLNLILPGYDSNSISVSVETTSNHRGPPTNALIITPKGKPPQAQLQVFQEKVFEIDPSVDLDNISVTFKNGILSITAPKMEVKVERNELKIKTGDEKDVKIIDESLDDNLEKKKTEKVIPTPAKESKTEEASSEVSDGIEIIDDED